MLASESFFKAIELDNAYEVGQFLKKGQNPNATNAEGQPAISYAMSIDSVDSVKMLLQNSSLDVNQRNLYGDTPLMIASIKDNSGWVAALLGKGAKLKTGSGHWTALHYAAASGSVKAVNMLLSAGANLDALSPNSTTPLMMAARENREDVVMLLLSRGADPTIVNQSGYNAAGYSLKRKNRPLAITIMKKAREFSTRRQSS